MEKFTEFIIDSIVLLLGIICFIIGTVLIISTFPFRFIGGAFFYGSWDSIKDDWELIKELWYTGPPEQL